MGNCKQLLKKCGEEYFTERGVVKHVFNVGHRCNRAEFITYKRYVKEVYKQQESEPKAEEAISLQSGSSG